MSAEKHLGNSEEGNEQKVEIKEESSVVKELADFMKTYAGEGSRPGLDIVLAIRNQDKNDLLDKLQILSSEVAPKTGVAKIDKLKEFFYSRRAQMAQVITAHLQSSE